MYCEAKDKCSKKKLNAGVVVYHHQGHSSFSSQMLPLLLYIWRAMAKIKGGYYMKARKIQESKIMKQPPATREIWDWLLMNANHTDKKYGEFTIKRGQLFRTYKDIREGLAWYIGWRKMTYNENRTKKAMKFLRSTLMIDTKKEPGGVLITIINYDYYHDPANYEGTTEETKEGTIEEPLKNQGAPTITRRLKKVKKEDKCVSVKAEELTELFCSTLKEKITVARKKKWSQEFDRIINRDRRRYSHEVLVKIINHYRLKDEFWSKNFMAPTKLLTTDSEGTKYIERFIEGRGFEPEDPHEQAYKELEARRKNE